MSTHIFSASRTALRPLARQQSSSLRRSFFTANSCRPAAFASSSAPKSHHPKLHTASSHSPHAPQALTASVLLPTMNATVLLASIAVAAGAYYVLYARNNHAAQAQTAPGKPVFSSFGFHTLQLVSSETVNHDVKRLRFDLGGDSATPSGLTLTSALLAITFPNGSWIPVPRPYTPVDIEQTGHVDFLVKKYPEGKQSTHLHNLQPGATVTFFRIPGYTYKPNEQAHIGLIAGGQGITPCYQLLRGILLNPEDRTRITLIWGANTEEDLILRDELADLQKQFPGRLTTKYVISRPSGPSAYATGHVNAALLKEVGIVPASEKGTGVGKVFMSGPPAMEKAFGKGGVLAGLGFTKAQTHTF